MAPLALYPQVRVVLLELYLLQLPLDVHLLRLWLAILAERLLLRADHALAGQTLLFDHCELPHPKLVVRHLGHVDGSSVLPHEQSSLRVCQDWLKDPNQRLLQLVIEVVLVV